jgi:putative ABC transport system ATP-binding protein
MTPLLEARGLTKYYTRGTVTVMAVEDVSFSLKGGEIALIIGPSGSGKSTLLSMLGCILRPSGGDILLAGHGVSGLSDRDLPRIRRRCFGFVFQSFHLFPFLTARENVETALRLRKTPAALRWQRSTDLLTSCGLADRMDFYPASLSGGEKQRVAIARALAGDPFILLADEPTASLDSANGELILRMLRRFAKNHGKAVVVASHDPKAREFADGIYSLVDGRITALDR